MKFLVILYLVLLTSLSVWAGDIQGEKIVLSSFNSLDEAKAKLKELEIKITHNEKHLQKKYHFEIVARQAGRGYIIAIEPIHEIEDAKKITKHFQKFFPDAYVSHYYGPTRGAIKLSFAVPTKSDVNTSRHNDPTLSAIKPPESEKIDIMGEPSVEKEDLSRDSYGWLWAPALLLIGVGGFVFIWRGIRRQREMFDDNDLIRDEEILDESEEVWEQNKAPIVDFRDTEPSVELDIFYRFMGNSFFLELIQKLQVACNAQEVVRCMGEIEKYQKNFRRSSVIATMSRPVSKGGFDELAQMIDNAMREGK